MRISPLQVLLERKIQELGGRAVDLAGKLGVTPAMVVKYRTGQSLPRFEDFPRFMDVLALTEEAWLRVYWESLQIRQANKAELRASLERAATEVERANPRRPFRPKRGAGAAAQQATPTGRGTEAPHPQAVGRSRGSRRAVTRRVEKSQYNRRLIGQDEAA
jgi:transcriptional regulator with XRE-family HTH domain